MIVGGEHIQSLWYDAASDCVKIIDQTRLPHHFQIQTLNSLQDVCTAITTMQVRGAPLIGVAAAYGVYLALREDAGGLAHAVTTLLATRPTAVNLQWALTRCEAGLAELAAEKRAACALELAQIMEKEDVAVCEAIGEHGARLLSELWKQKQDSQACLNILTHCNAGALATVDWGTALSVVYKAAALEVPLHVWVDETRPRNQGASLTCWELAQSGIEHTLIVDNAGGHLMQQGKVDLCVVGSDRTTLTGDVCNKIGTYLKALAAKDNNIPFYVALPVSSIDFTLEDGVRQIPIEQRNEAEVLSLSGVDAEGLEQTVSLAPAGSKASNYGFDVTPARLVTALITERGVLPATREAISALLD